MLLSLSNIPFFEGLDEVDAGVLLSVTRTVQVPGNTKVFWQGDEADAQYIIRSGTLQVTTRDLRGRETVLAALKAGDYFGEMSLIDGEARSASVTTLEPCVLLCLGTKEFNICLDTNVGIARTVMKSLAKRLREGNARVAAPR